MHMSKIMRNGNKYGGTASSMAKDIVFNPVQDYLANVSCCDNLDEYRSYRATKAPTVAVAPQVSTSRTILTPRDNSLFTLEEGMGR